MPQVTGGDRPYRDRVLVVLAGGLVGSSLRLAVGSALGWEPGGWPVATLAANLAGAGAVGWYLARRVRSAASWWSLDFWAIGVLGSLTTFSALSVETVSLLEAGRAAAAGTYAVVSSMAGVAMAAVGHRIGARR